MEENAARLYHEEIVERSRISRSANNKKHGSNTQKLGNKRMSWQEIAGKHGPVSEWCLKDFLTWDIFIQMPNDLKVEYIDRLCNEYDISIQHISSYLFNKGGDGLRAYLRNTRDKDGKRLFDKCDTLKPRANSGLLQFRNDIDEWKKRVATAEEIDRMEEEARLEEAPGFITWEQFKKLEPQAMVTYLNSLIDFYGVGYSMIARKVFKVSECCVHNKLKTKKVHDKIHFHASRDCHSAEYKEKINHLTKDVETWRAGMDIKDQEKSNVVDFPIAINQQPMLFVDPYTGTKFSLNGSNIEAIKEKIDEINNDIHDTNESDSVTLQKFIDSITEEPATETTVEPVSDPMLYHDSSFTSNYIRVGLDMDELIALGILFKNKKVRVNIEITELD